MKKISFFLQIIAIHAVFTLLGPATVAAETLHVPLNFPTIQEAIDSAVNGDMVLVAPGTYVENINFLGKEITVLSEEGPEVTHIDGNKAGSVVTFDSGEGLTSVLSGFTITNGEALYPGGGGILCYESSPTITNCKIVKNSSSIGGGGGISSFGSSSSPAIENCMISENSSLIGGGIFCYFSSPTISNCTISKNSADYGGGVRFDSATSIITNSIIIGNTANYLGGGILCSFWDSPTIINCTISGNSASNGGGIGCTGATYSGSFPKIINSVLWANIPNEIYHDTYSMPSVTFSDIQNGFTGEGNINLDPLFLDTSAQDPNNWDLHLQSSSPCIDAGDNSPPELPNTDFDGKVRSLDGNDDNEAVVDMGAFEYQATLNIAIDIKPRSDINLISINPSSRGVTPVAVLTSQDFDATMVDPLSVRFGPNGAEEAHERGHIQDVDMDGDHDLLLHFTTRETGIECGDVEASLSGETFDNVTILGTDSIMPIPCR